MLLLLCQRNCAYSSAVIDFRHVSKGYVSPFEGYLASEETGRTILRALRTYRTERDHWISAYNMLQEEHNLYTQRASESIGRLETSLEQERQMWKDSVRKAKRPGIGVFAGPAYCGDGSIQAVIGIGLVYKLW